MQKKEQDVVKELEQPGKLIETQKKLKLSVAKEINFTAKTLEFPYLKGIEQKYYSSRGKKTDTHLSKINQLQQNISNKIFRRVEQDITVRGTNMISVYKLENLGKLIETHKKLKLKLTTKTKTKQIWLPSSEQQKGETNGT